MLGYMVNLFVLLGVASAGVVIGGVDDRIGVGLVGGGHGVVDLHTPPKYEFKYGVEDPKTGDRKQQSEVRVNDVVRGEYSLAEPDGTIRVVKYTADDHNGFNAVVSRVGHAVHPQILIKKAVVPIAHHGIAVPVVGHGISVGGLGLGGGLLDVRGGLLGGHGGILDGRGGILDGREGILDGRGGILDVRGGLLGGHGGILDVRGGVLGGQGGILDGRGGLDGGILGLGHGGIALGGY